MSPELGDQILQHLRLSLLDLIDKPTLQRYANTENHDAVQYSYVPMLDGLVGPGYPWPDRVVKDEKFPIPAVHLNRLAHPVVAKLAGDSRMHPLFGDGDNVLLDQSHRARTEIDPKAYYVVKRGSGGLVRRARLVGKQLFLIAEDSVDRPAAWEQVHLDQQQLQHVVRARALFLARDTEWTC